MAKILLGKPVAEALDERTRGRVEALAMRGIVPTLAIVRVGENPADVSYERSVVKRAEALGVRTIHHGLPQNAATQEVAAVIDEVNASPDIHGCLLFRPLPDHIDEASLCDRLAPEKDVDGISRESLTGVLTGIHHGFPPATAQACVEVLDHYGIPIEGAHITVVGRSNVIGLPVAQLLLHRNATITQCHSRTTDLARHTRAADIVICASGRARAYGSEFFCDDGTQAVLDVGINFDAEGVLCGDVDFEAVEPRVCAITPVPRGIGSVTTSVTLMHTVQAAEPEGPSLRVLNFPLENSSLFR